MSFALIIFIRVLFVACMVFILGYIFGSFGKRPVLKTLSRVAAILMIVLFIGMNLLFVRATIGGHRHHGPWNGGRGGWQKDCPFEDERRGQDSLGQERPERDPVPQVPDGEKVVSSGQSTSSVTLILNRK